ncbi:Carbohydrate esterase family 16 protein [Mycena kentingensis (nom. inval.)]|nr:Carbohydrate esterase family 16 protein [Mycena kentingensis (nom. inval.)]
MLAPLLVATATCLLRFRCTTTGIKPAYWFSFGDSYTQTGFNVTAGPLPSLASPLGNPAYPGLTATPGPNWIDVATVQYNHSRVRTYNFAFSGATVSRDLQPPFAEFVQTLPDQIASMRAWSEAGGSAEWRAPGREALFSIWIGINDIDQSWARTDVDHAQLTKDLVARYLTHVQTLVLVSSSWHQFLRPFLTSPSDIGARNFLIINVPPLPRAPGMLAPPITPANRTFEAALIADYNALLFSRVRAFAASKRSHGVRLWLYDAFEAFTRVLDNPEWFGFNDTTGDDGVTGGQFWFNWIHPVSAAQVIFGREISDILAG